METCVHCSHYSYDEKIISWIVYCLRILLGDEKVRNIIQNRILQNDKIYYGKTFGIDNGNKEKRNIIITQYLDFIIKVENKDYATFTISNHPDLITEETHYQGFMIDYKNKKLYIFDPAFTTKGSGIYKPYISEDLVLPFFESNSWKTEFIVFSNPCQTNQRDVFCQTWSLIMIIKMLNYNYNDIPIKEKDKYVVLAEFYRQIIEIPEIYNIFEEIWKETLEEPDVPKFEKINLLSVIRNLTYFDILDKGNESKCVVCNKN
jgi:hypothetical protein